MPITIAARAGHQSQHKYTFKKFVNGRWQYYYDRPDGYQAKTKYPNHFLKYSKKRVTKQRAGESISKKISRRLHNPIITNRRKRTFTFSDGTTHTTTVDNTNYNSRINRAWYKLGDAYDNASRGLNKLKNKLPWGKRRSKASYKVNFKRTRSRASR